MSVRSEVESALEGQTGWRVDLALALASEVDSNGTASAAKELRAVMDQLEGPAATSKETGLSEFEQRLRERESAAPAPRRAKG